LGIIKINSTYNTYPFGIHPEWDRGVDLLELALFEEPVKEKIREITLVKKEMFQATKV
jgi:hypothetical protein